MLDIFFLIILFIIGFIVAYEDIRIGKVRNKFIFTGLLAGAIGYLVLVTQALFFSEIGLFYFKKIFLNVLISWVIAFLLWFFGLWAAGDAKIFMLFSFLFPLKYYGNDLIMPFFPAINLLVNAFIFVLFFILSEIIFRLIVSFFHFLFNLKIHWENALKNFPFRKEKLNRIIVNKSEYLKIGLVFLSLFMLRNIFRLYVQERIIKTLPELDKFFFIIIILAFRAIRKFIKKMKINILYSLIIILAGFNLLAISLTNKRYVFEFTNLFKNFAGFMLIIFIFFRVINLYMKRKEQMKISVKDITPRLVLSHESIGLINEHLKKEGRKEKFYADGLTVQQVDYIKGLALKKSDFKEVVIYKTFPLAPFIFLGTIATLVTRGLVINLDIIAAIGRTVFSKVL